MANTQQKKMSLNSLSWKKSLPHASGFVDRGLWFKITKRLPLQSVHEDKLFSYFFLKCRSSGHTSEVCPINCECCSSCDVLDAWWADCRMNSTVTLAQTASRHLQRQNSEPFELMKYLPNWDRRNLQQRTRARKGSLCVDNVQSPNFKSGSFETNGNKMWKIELTKRSRKLCQLQFWLQ